MRRAAALAAALLAGACNEPIDLGGHDGGRDGGCDPASCTCAAPCAPVGSCDGGALSCTCDCPQEISVDMGTGFPMGCASGDTQCGPEELPTHNVQLTAYRIYRTEVTQRQFSACVAAGACSAPSCGYTPAATPNLPVVCVHWSQASAFCTWGSGHLPTEAQWEYAARRDDRNYPWGTTAPTCAQANFSGCGGAPQAVGSHPTGASPWGALDMAGNVSEWVADVYSDTYYSMSPAVDPLGPMTTTNSRGIRGGNFNSPAARVRVSARTGDAPELNALLELGFRCAR